MTVDDFETTSGITITPERIANLSMPGNATDWLRGRSRALRSGQQPSRKVLLNSISETSLRSTNVAVSTATRKFIYDIRLVELRERIFKRTQGQRLSGEGNNWFDRRKNITNSIDAGKDRFRQTITNERNTDENEFGFRTKDWKTWRWRLAVLINELLGITISEKNISESQLHAGAKKESKAYERDEKENELNLAYKK